MKKYINNLNIIASRISIGNNIASRISIGNNIGPRRLIGLCYKFIYNVPLYMGYSTDQSSNSTVKSSNPFFLPIPYKYINTKKQVLSYKISEIHNYGYDFGLYIGY